MINIFKKPGKAIKEATITQPIMVVKSSKDIITTFFKELFHVVIELYKLLKHKKQNH